MTEEYALENGKLLVVDRATLGLARQLAAKLGFSIGPRICGHINTLDHAFLIWYLGNTANRDREDHWMRTNRIEAFEEVFAICTNGSAPSDRTLWLAWNSLAVTAQAVAPWDKPFLWGVMRRIRRTIGEDKFGELCRAFAG